MYNNSVNKWAEIYMSDKTETNGSFQQDSFCQ
jgi:hypothetical protein